MKKWAANRHPSFNIGLLNLAVLLAADCLQAKATDLPTKCFVHFPQLAHRLG